MWVELILIVVYLQPAEGPATPEPAPEETPEQADEAIEKEEKETVKGARTGMT